MTKCPRCFNFLPGHLSVWMEANPTSTSLNDIASSYRGHPVQTGNVITYELTDGQPPTASQLSQDFPGIAVEVCPICHYQLPVYWRDGHATCLAMAGARSTGKTVYIAVVIKQLQRHLERLGLEVEPADPTTRQRHTDNYERPLFEERGILPPTSSAQVATTHQHDPLIFSLGIWNGVREYLVVRDVAGEDLEKDNVGGPAWEFFAAADAVLFLFDPMRVEEIKHQLHDLIPTTATSGGDPRDALRTVMRLIGDGNPKLAVILSKFDALQELQRVTQSSWGKIMGNAGAAFSRDPALLGGFYDETDGILLHAEVHSLLQKLDAGPMLSTMRNPYSGRTYVHRFFAVSALGDAPHGDRLHASGIAPFRCLDPIRWVLADRQVLT